MMATIEDLRAAGVLASLDVHFARALGRIGGEPQQEVLLAAALVSRHVSHGHVCLDLPRFVRTETVDDAGMPVERHAWPPLAPWLDALRSSPLITAGDAVAPLVLDAAGRLYLRRYWEHQERLAAAIRTRSVIVDPVDRAWLRPALDRFFPADATQDMQTPDWQRIAALLALRRRFCVISGGPGTGKTYTVVKILALLIEQAQRAGQRLPRVTLLAPTGKAAARLAESIRQAKNNLNCDAAVRAAIPEEAATIHRCLGVGHPVAGSGTALRHHAGNPLLTDVVLVDEASMVDLALMARLTDALPPSARLILLGDKDQLASVEAGAVLGDICNSGAAHSYSVALIDDVATLSGDRLPRRDDTPSGTGLWDCIVHLSRSYRYGAASAIGALARAVNAGDSAAALEILTSDAGRDLRLLAPDTPGQLNRTIRETVVPGYLPYLQATQPEERRRDFDRFRVLCAHRRGPDGVEVLNQAIEAALSEAGLLRIEGPTYAGRPIIITRNDYQLGLFNGDVGLLVDDPDGVGRTLACFPAPDGTQRLLSPSRLPPHDTVFAMSIHKSQGSEFDAVAVLLPERVSSVLSRELLYTAITRARRTVTVHATREMVAQAIARPIERASGLRELLWG